MTGTPALRLLRQHAAPIATGVAGAAAILALLLWFWPRPSAAPTKDRVVQMVQVDQPEELPVEQPVVEPEEKVEEPVIRPEPIVPVRQDRPVVDSTNPLPATVPSEAPSQDRSEGGLNRPADSGSDSYRLSAGKGGGLFGRGGGAGGGGGDWEAAIALHITRALQRDSRTRVARGSLRVSVVIEEDGRFGSARLRSSTGDAALDAAIRDVLTRLSPMNRRRPPDVGPATNMAIDLKRAGG